MDECIKYVLAGQSEELSKIYLDAKADNECRLASATVIQVTQS